MSHSARLLPAIADPEIVRVERPRSFFALRNSRFGRFGAPLARIFSQARQLQASFLAIEQLPQEGELADESEDLAVRLGAIDETLVWRICFFASPVSDDDESSADFLGYAILREDWWKAHDKVVARIHESVLKLQDRGHNYVPGVLEWEVRCGDSTRLVAGHLFTQQNDLTNVCAHAALRTVCAVHLLEKDLTYRQINDWLGIDHSRGRHVGADADDPSISRGLQLGQIEEVLEKVGASVFSHYFGPQALLSALGGSQSVMQGPPGSLGYQHSLYGCLESGYPALLVFGTVVTQSSTTARPLMDLAETRFHVIPVIGHTFNQDMWVPRAETTWRFQISEDTGYLPSDLWLSAFIAHDDSLGSNYCIPKHYLPPIRFDETNAQIAQHCSGVVAVLQALPSGVHRDAVSAELQALTALKMVFSELSAAQYGRIPPSGQRWLHHLCYELDENRLVLRPILVGRRAYLDHLASLRGWEDADGCRERISSEFLRAVEEAISADGHLEKFWMVEFSVMELFPANLRKLGEVLVSASSMELLLDDPKVVWAIRLPGLGLTCADGEEGGYMDRAVVSGLFTHAPVFGAGGKG